MREIVDRSFDPRAADALVRAGLHPVLARVFAGRGVAGTEDLDLTLRRLHPPDAMRNLARLGGILADAIERGQRLLIVGDYDCDGATASAVGVLALRACGAQVDYLVPNRFEYGYGLTPEIVRVAAERRPDMLITVDNGIASVDGVAEANRLRMRVVITDHHLPGAALPDAECIVNPNQPGCGFPSKHLAGVGVMFYAMLALRAELRARRRFAPGEEPNLAELLDLVALGTVADVVPLDRNNRVLVQHGLARIRAGRARPGINALLAAAGRDPTRCSSYELGFVLGPRLNAAGRLEDMSVGIECLLAADEASARPLAQRLDQLNRERRGIEAQMHESALEHLARFDPGEAYGVALYDAGWHQGVVGILASRVRERVHRPVIAFAPGADGELKGSGRSIPGLHLRDALDLLDKRHPGLLLRFGGHAAAAGVSIRATEVARFRTAFDETVRGLLGPADLARQIDTDGELRPVDMTLELAQRIGELVWGQGFPAPLFRGRFRLVQQRVVGGGHLKLRLAPIHGALEGLPVDAILFGRADPLPGDLMAVFRLDTNEWNGSRAVQLVLEHVQPAGAGQPLSAAAA
jgi:single-stranded-DNA-specific exonuclease